MENLKKQIVHEINLMSHSDLINLNNLYASEILGNFNDEIFYNEDEFFNTFFYENVIGAIQCVSYGDYRYSDNYVKFNGYGNLESFNFMSHAQLCELPETMAEDIINKFEEFEYLFSNELCELINQYEF
jgi:hypothetical protein